VSDPWERAKGVENRWRELARERLDREEREGLDSLGVEFFEEVEVFGEVFSVPITLEELKKVGEMAKHINRFKIRDAVQTLREMREELVPWVEERDLLPLANTLLQAKIVHDRQYLKVYAFWKAVEGKSREL